MCIKRHGQLMATECKVFHGGGLLEFLWQVRYQEPGREMSGVTSHEVVFAGRSNWRLLDSTIFSARHDLRHHQCLYSFDLETFNV